MRPPTTRDDLARVLFLTAATLPPHAVECVLCHETTPWWDVWQRTDGQLVEVCLGCSNDAGSAIQPDLTGVASGTTGIIQIGPDTEAVVRAWAQKHEQVRSALEDYWPTVPYKTVPDPPAPRKDGGSE